MCKKYTILVVGLIQMMGIISCSEQIKPTPYLYTKVFTGEKSKTWKVKFLEQTLHGEINDTFTIACAADDQYTFYANAERTLEVNAGSNKCSSNEASLITDSWSFNNASATLQMLLPFLVDSNYPYLVIEASKNKMVLEVFFDAANTESYRIHFESTHEE